MFVSFDEALTFLTTQKENPKYNLENIIAAAKLLWHPERSFKSIHITWTNGKGSVSRMVYQILKEAGYSVGIFLSPHLIDVRERFVVDDTWIDDESFIEIQNTLLNLNVAMSRFEKYVLTAFLYFQKKQVDYAVIEVWVWAKNDATNILIPEVSVITYIGLDHPKTLWTTLEEVAMHKSAIIKPWKPVVVGTAYPLLQEVAQKNNSPLVVSDTLVQTNLIGEFQKKNAWIAYEVGKLLWISEPIIKSWLQKVQHKGRLQYVLPNLLVDGAHNPDWLESLKKYIATISFSFEKVVLCFWLKKEREVSRITDVFWNVENYCIVNYWQQILEPPENLVFQMKEKNIETMFLAPEEIHLMAKKEPHTLFVVFGSLYMIGQFLKD